LTQATFSSRFETMKRELDPSEEDVLDVRASLVSVTSAESSIDKPENMSLLAAECLSDCSRAVLARTAALSDVASASRPQSSDASEAVPNVRDAEQCGPNTKDSFSGEDSSSFLLYKLPNGPTVNLKGWRQAMRGGAVVIIGPQGDEYTSMHYAYEALQLEQQGSHGNGRSCALKAMSRILAEFMERHSPEPTSTVVDKEVTRASGPARSTTAAPQEINAAAADDASKLTQWMSILDGQLEGVAEISSLTALQRVSERMESQAGRLVSSELLAVLDDRSYGGLDELVRERLRSLCKDFHRQCVKFSREDEISAIHWRVQSLAQGTEAGPSEFVH
jgi:hypothetical protein